MEASTAVASEPVQHEGYFRLTNDRPRALLEAGLSAMSNYTDLADGPQPTYATTRNFLRTQPNIKLVPYREPDTVVIQRWWYSPAVLASDKRSVDRLSLYLSFKDSADERVQSALEQLLAGMKW